MATGLQAEATTGTEQQLSSSWVSTAAGQYCGLMMQGVVGRSGRLVSSRPFEPGCGEIVCHFVFVPCSCSSRLVPVEWLGMLVDARSLHVGQAAIALLVVLLGR